MIKDNTFCVADAVDLLRQIPDNSVDLVYTDPPYNISNKNKFWKDYRKKDGGSTKTVVSMDFGEWDYNYNPESFLIEAKRVLKPHGSLIIWTSEQLYGTYRAWVQEHMYPKQMLIWEKTNPMPNFRKVSYRQATELMIWAVKEKSSKNYFLFTTQEDTKNIKHAPIVGGKERRKLPDGKSHPTQKPLKICRELIRTHCPVGGLVVDPYCGVGTIPLAASLEGCRFIGGDYDIEYIMMAEKRLEEGY